MLKTVVVIVMVGAACAAPITPTRRRCADGHIVFANGTDTSPVDSAPSAERGAHARFFKRLELQVRQHWQPQRLWQRLGAKTAAYTFGKTTEIAVTLARNGHVLAVCVVSPSGINEFDDEALRAFWAAGQFRDPPVSLFGGREHVTFPFGFFYGGRSSALSAPVLW